MSSQDRRRAGDRPGIQQNIIKTGADTTAALQGPTVSERGALRAMGSQGPLGYTSRIGQLTGDLARQWFEPAARAAIFIIYFWFGVLKLIGLSPATPLASALTSHTIGMQYFNLSFKALALYECGLGMLFLIPALTWISVGLLVIHMGVVSSPLVIVANVAWTHPLVPTLEGQYIIKDLAIIALAVGLIAQRRSPGRQPEAQVKP